MRLWKLFFALCLGTMVADPVLSQSLSGSMDFSGLSSGQNPRRMSDEQLVEALEAKLLQDVFVASMIPPDSSLLTEEEKEESPINVDGNDHHQMMVQMYSQKLAKEDVLKLKKTLLKAIKRSSGASL